MAKRATETTGKAVETTAGSAGKAERNESGFYCYIGPNLKKLIQTGTIYRGTRKDALAKAADAIAAEPLVKRLIVSGDDLPEARIKVRTPGNSLNATYQKLMKK